MSHRRLIGKRDCGGERGREEHEAWRANNRCDDGEKAASFLSRRPLFVIGVCQVETPVGLIDALSSGLSFEETYLGGKCTILAP